MCVPIDSIKSGKWDGTKERGDTVTRAQLSLCNHEDKGDWTRGTGIVATPESYAAIMTLKDALERLTEQLEAMTTPDAIGAFLGHMSTLKMLPIMPDASPDERTVDNG